MEPLFIGPYDLGVQQNMKPFMIPEAAFPFLLNMLVFRGRVQRKNGYGLLGRLKLVARTKLFTTPTVFTLTQTADGSAVYDNANILADAGVGIATAIPTARLVPGTLVATVTVGGQTFTDVTGLGVLVGSNVLNSGTINYATGRMVLTFNAAAPAAGVAITVSMQIYPNLPVMTIATRQLTTENLEQTVFFDTRYAYIRNGSNIQELPSAIPTQWSGTDLMFYSTTSFQQDVTGVKYFWEVNNNPGFTAFNITLFGAAAAGPPSTVQVTAAGNTFAVGDVVTFVGLVGAGAAANNGKTGVVTVAGNPFTVQNPDAGVFGNGAITQGVAIKGDSLRYYKPTTWVYTYPLLNIPTAILPPRILVNALLVIPYKGRLLVLNTWEADNPAANSAVNYAQRVRWSQNFIATDVIDGWVDTIVGRGGYVDAPTGEQITACGFVKDVLIVYFENSTWQLLYTGNELLPFQWQRINSELGADATFSSVLFDNGLMVVGNVGVHVCNGQTCARIDQVIPDEIFQMHNTITGPNRTCGIRDFFMECVYFAYANSVPNTSATGNRFYPNQILCYNYRNESYSFFDDHATAFGLYQNSSNITWADLIPGSGYSPWEAWQAPWNSGALQAGFPAIVFGNQQGFIEQIDYENSSNGPSLYIDALAPDPLYPTDGVLITSNNYNLYAGQYVNIVGVLGDASMVALNGNSYMVLRVGSDLAQTNGNTQFAITGTPTISGTYTGGGTMSVLSNVDIKTKMFTPFWSQGKRYDLRYIDLLFDSTTSGELQVDIYIDFSSTNSMTAGSPGVRLGFPIVSTAPESLNNLPYYSFQKEGDQIWKRFYADANGSTFQLQLSMNDTEMRTPAINTSDVVLHGMILFFNDSGEFL